MRTMRVIIHKIESFILTTRCGARFVSKDKELVVLGLSVTRKAGQGTAGAVSLTTLLRASREKNKDYTMGRLVQKNNETSNERRSLAALAVEFASLIFGGRRFMFCTP